MSARSRTAVRVWLCLCLCLSPWLAPAVAGADTAESRVVGVDAGESRVVSVLPDPVADDDAGERVTVALAPGPHRLTDGETTVELRGPGRVVVTADPDRVDARGRVVHADLALSNAGERLTLFRNGSRVHRVAYPAAESGSRYHVAAGRWQPVGLRERAAVAVGPANLTAFVLPDAPTPPVATLRAADDRLLLAGYTLGSERVVAALRSAADRGVTVRVLLDGDPVGGIGRRQARLTTELTDAGVPVRLVGGDGARFRFHHPKYAVADDEVIVATENWKPSGTGGASNRGWGVQIRDAVAARELAAVFRHDWRGRGARPWSAVAEAGGGGDGGNGADAGNSAGDGAGDGNGADGSGPATGEFPTRFTPASFEADATFLLTAPGNAGSAVAATVAAADRRVAVIQPTVERGRLLTALRRAAARGVRVRLLLSSAWYVEADNRALADRLSAWADRENATLAVRLAEPGGAFERIHAKGVVADDTAVVGSLNWNPTSVRENREVAVAVRDPAVADYYLQVFDADWNGPGDGTSFVAGTVPPLLAVAVVGAVAGVALLARRRLRFADEP